MNKDKIILEYLSTYVDAIEYDDYAEHNNGRSRLYYNWDNLREDVRERLQNATPDSDIEEGLL